MAGTPTRMLHALPQRSFFFAALLLAASRVAQAQPALPEPPPSPAAPAAPAAPTAPTAPTEPGAPAAPTAQLIVTGRVVDSRNRPVRGTSVRLETSPTGVHTGADGRFALALPPGAALGANLIIEAPRFELSLTPITAAALGDVTLTTEQEETIEIFAEAPPPAPGAAVLDRAELQRIPGAAGDLVKSLTVMPGVVNLQVPLGYSGVTIRGSSPQDSKVFVDGFDVPVIFHNIGFRANLPAEAIASMDYIPGGFDVAYGRASSGIIDVKTRPGADQRSTQAEVSLLDGGLLAQGPAGEATRYMVSLRRSTIDFALPALLPDDVNLSFTTVPSYWDAQLRLDHELSRKWRLSLSGIGAVDVVALYTSKQEVEEKRIAQEFGFGRLTATARYQDGPWTASFALSALHAELHTDIGRMQHVDLETPSLTPRAEVGRAVANRGILGGLVRDLSLRAGAEAPITRTKLGLAISQETRDGEPEPPEDPDDVSTMFDGTFVLPNVATWLAASANLGPRLRATAGVRLDYFGRNEELALQPRVDLSYKLAPRWTALASGGMFTRAPEFQSELTQDDLLAERSNQAIAGLRFEPREGARVQASAYYYDRDKLITHEEDGSLANRGQGHTVGSELLATYRGGPWFAWLSYSYSRSERVDQPGGKERLFSYDQPHSMNAAASWQLGKWQLGARFQLYSGLPYTPVAGATFDSDRDRYMPNYGEPNSERAPIHHQLDLRVDRSWKWGPVQMTGFLDVQNVYMNESPITYEYSYDYTQRAAVRSIPILPSIGLRGVL